MAFDLTCPRCGFRYSAPAHLETVAFFGNANNVVSPCPRCGHEFDAAPGDGTYSVVGRRLQRVAETLAESSRDELEELRAEIRRLADRQDQAGALAVAQSLGWPPAEGDKSQLTTGNEALDFIIKLQIVLGLMLQGTEWSVDLVQRLLAQWVN